MFLVFRQLAEMDRFGVSNMKFLAHQIMVGYHFVRLSHDDLH